ncbi:MAG: type II CAAX endopeptidase family protein [Methylococcaceae bacterium]|nr:type II CAAX endopeptidase family protein [Methylococcaceae bacterium]MDZ4157015.1 type II CAAX endopeptidase family protein [Methylococcales bacterium]MDP2394232.1 type II CAAX endopeptidase family protein [Methylococcaceae bacterium]MDP3020060.1 type II CAAX endopeptidase family protein [Methylococcaceae bacterium]MDP3388802.1 type II CAAX endopeptidase family protein [Methylococcaceae bacterium]
MRIVIYALMPLLVLLAITSNACLLAYLIAWGMDDPSLLRKLIIRITQISLLLSIYPLMRTLKLTKEDLGLAEKKIFISQLLRGFGLGILTLLPIFIVLYLFEINVFDDSQPWSVGLVLKKITIALLLASLIGIVEEMVFRGMLLAGLRRNLPVIAAVLLTSTYYAALHFLDSKSPVSAANFSLLTSFQLLIEAFINIFNPDNTAAFCALLMVGIFLAVIRVNNKHSLAVCIGCHAGWVFQIKMSKSLFNTNPNSEYLAIFEGHSGGILGPLATVWLAVLVVGYIFYKKNQSAGE